MSHQKAGTVENLLPLVESLIAHLGDLSLDNFASISPEVADVLGRHQGGSLSLNGLTDVSVPVAAALAEDDTPF